MEIRLREIKVKELFDKYTDNDEEGVRGYGGKLNIRPKYQREFIYKDKQQQEVINTIRKNFPLNVMYWAKNNNDHEEYELLDGQQRTLSICKYIAGDFSIDYQYFHNLTDEEKDQILNYKLMIYVCEGTEREKLDWFRIINIAGEKLTDQELRNAVYSGTWVNDAKKYFSKTNCAAQNAADGYLEKTVNRQLLLETALKWISNENIEKYMSEHQCDENAKELWDYFLKVITWARKLFDSIDSKVKKIVLLNQEWGLFYNKYHQNSYDPEFLKSEVNRLLEDEDVEKKSGIVSYLFTNKESHLNIRAFSKKQKEIAFGQLKVKKCAKCSYEFKDVDDTEADHIKPWSKKGKTELSNLQLLCRNCNRTKSNI
ncbi:DUF262 domain-containing protein [Mycoplasma sp. E35C]|uniref:HNH endonuclease family protein n=1 Tax=Mycoplasma sp. E35C TaxID=2801918 RepID=UPI001CA38982|nr:DUF262 domain-containing protein [Mycoplasma sp. E35C]QZX49091.1 DUF262 domain-containing protein [Mycoplasma sp. E35C]